MLNQECHPPGCGSHDVLHTVRLVSVANRSRMVSFGRHSAVTIAPGYMTWLLVMNQDCHPDCGCHHVVHTMPSASVANRSRWVSFGRRSAVTVAPGFMTWSSMVNQECHPPGRGAHDVR